jgi:hypothetical protein
MYIQMPRYALADGRTFTDYNTDAEVNEMLQKSNGITNSNDYRYFLQHNATKLMEEARSKSLVTSKANYTTYDDKPQVPVSTVTDAQFQQLLSNMKK